MMNIGVWLLTLVALTSCTVQDQKGQQTMEPGYQYVIGNKDNLLVSVSHGLADIYKGEELTNHHIMSTFSMTKTITAIAILQLSERGQLDLNDSLNVWIDTPYPDEVTVRHLITHTSGIANPIPLKWIHLPESRASFDEKNELNALMAKNSRVKSKPGSKYRYSNLGYWLAGKVIEKVSGKSYQEYIEQNVFAPLNLKEDQVNFTIHESEMAKGYLKRHSPMGLIAPLMMDRNILSYVDKSWIEIRTVYVNGPAYGGIFATSEGMFTILQDLLNKESVLLSVRSKDLLFSQQQDSKGREIQMTLGWHVSTINDRPYFYKEGGGAGYRSEMRIYPNEGLASVIIANRTSYAVGRKLNQLDELMVHGKNSNPSKYNKFN